MIRVDISKCTGCRQCETVCAFFHTGRINHHQARIKVLNLYEIGIDGPVVCQQCEEHYCMCCPEKALSIGSFGQMVVSPTVCNLCGTCEKVCPIGAIEIFSDFVYVCDLCGGNPRCVEICTEGAITWNPDEVKHPSFSELKQRTKKMNSSEKRWFYLKSLGYEVRKKWGKVRA